MCKEDRGGEEGSRGLASWYQRNQPEYAQNSEIHLDYIGISDEECRQMAWKSVAARRQPPQAERCPSNSPSHIRAHSITFLCFTMSYTAKAPKIGTGAPKCPTCQKSVYFNEQVLALDKAWHKRCLKCAQCSKVLDPGNLSDRDGADLSPMLSRVALHSLCSLVYYAFSSPPQILKGLR